MCKYVLAHKPKEFKNQNDEKKPPTSCVFILFFPLCNNAKPYDTNREIQRITNHLKPDYTSLMNYLARAALCSNVSLPSICHPTAKRTANTLWIRMRWELSRQTKNKDEESCFPSITAHTLKKNRGQSNLAEVV